MFKGRSAFEHRTSLSKRQDGDRLRRATSGAERSSEVRAANERFCLKLSRVLRDTGEAQVR